MIPDCKKVNFPREMTFAKRVFDFVEDDIEFLLVVKPPFKLKDSIAYLTSPDGQKYLTLKRKEFYFKPREQDFLLDDGVKFGEDMEVKPKPTIRKFLE